MVSNMIAVNSDAADFYHVALEVWDYYCDSGRFVSS